MKEDEDPITTEGNSLSDAKTSTPENSLAREFVVKELLA